MTEPRKSLAGIDAFRDLAANDLQQLERLSKLIEVQRGQLLFRQGELADALYLVVSGRFEVMRDDEVDPVAEIGAGLPIGEIAFFSGGTRTANIVAERDSVVLKLDRDDFDVLARGSPRIWTTVTSTLARRLAETTASRGKAPIRPRPKTYCLLPAGSAPIAPEFLQRLRAVFERHMNVLFFDATDLEKIKRAVPDDTRWLNEVESRYDAVVFVTDPDLSTWSQKAIRQADLVLCIGQTTDAGSPAGRQVTDLEQYAAALHKSGRLRLVLLHEHSGGLSDARRWLDLRPWCVMHHHVVRDQNADYERLFRFLTDRALGLVACGGGAFSTAHIGFYQAFREAGIVFDMMGGTSGGAAMTAAFAIGTDPDEIERRAHDIFVSRKALSRWTLPRYSLFDPTVLDDAFREHFTAIDIADLPIPYFAVSTNLSRNSVYCHRSGPLWHAVRASCTIPALLPPMYSDDGDMLVDGGLLENVPIKSMHALKSGPNIVIDFQVPMLDPFAGAAGTAPSRRQLIIGSLTPRGRRQLPRGPSPQAVLLRSLMLHGHNVRAELGAEDVLLEPLMPAGISHLDWHKHDELRRFGYEFARREISRLKLTSVAVLG